MFVSTNSGFNDLCPTLCDLIVTQQRVLGKQYSVTAVQQRYLLRRELLRMRQEKGARLQGSYLA